MEYNIYIRRNVILICSGTPLEVALFFASLIGVDWNERCIVPRRFIASVNLRLGFEIIEEVIGSHLSPNQQEFSGKSWCEDNGYVGQ